MVKNWDNHQTMMETNMIEMEINKLTIIKPI